jgi:predicted transcriptional regulator
MNTRLELDDDIALRLSEVARKYRRTPRGQAYWYVLEGLERDRELWPDLNDHPAVDQTVAA